MRIHVWGINYSPEVTGIAPYNVVLCESLAQRGNQVRMITSFCYYPAWQKLPNEKNLLFRTDDMEGVTVHRCWHYVPKKVTTLKRIFHELSFVVTSFLRQLLLEKPDFLVVISPPLFLGIAAWLLTRIKRTKFVFHVQDLQPDAAAELGMVRSKFLLNALRQIESFSYRKAVRVSGISPEMLRAFQRKHVPKEKCIYFPNGVELPEFWRLPERGRFRTANKFVGDDFLVVYSGNLGRKQGLDILLETAAVVGNPAVKFVVCGDGAERENLERRAVEMGLNNVRFLPLLAEIHYREMLVDADLCAIPQQPGSGRAFFPSKLLKALAFSSPVLALADPASELSEAVRDGRFGISLPSEQSKGNWPANRRTHRKQGVASKLRQSRSQVCQTLRPGLCSRPIRLRTGICLMPLAKLVLRPARNPCIFMTFSALTGQRGKTTVPAQTFGKWELFPWWNWPLPLGERGCDKRLTEIKLKKGESVEKALRRLKKRIDREGTLREVRNHRHYEKPSERRRRKMKVARFSAMLSARYADL